ncbi:MAG: aspartate aminotransferase [Rhodospirillaceae bacterium TMED8]|nr:aspartate aminotransferase [Magnetovibrio sp.]OUT48952.1 MAG: aspartate aminotransferase [Rhodospirillaceae bacterium TMED8]|tara:strand:- start:760 stop:1962 length:1203 start_codon:yes stop_codon:yes gene_type:complete
MVHAAERTRRITTSASSAATQRARELTALGHDIIVLTQGQPDFETPDYIIEAATAAMRNGETRYTPVTGTVALRDAIRFKFMRDNRIDFTDDQVMASNGGKQIIYNALMSTLEPGDEVITSAPYWVSYIDMTKFAEGVPVVIECRGDNEFKLTPTQLAQSITPKTRWVILNSPNNPAGGVYTDRELSALANVISPYERIMVMSDDIYEHIIYDDQSYSTMASAAPDLVDRILTINGVSKAYSMTGWRIGFCGGPAPLIKTMSKLQNQSTGNPCSVSQAAAVAALTGSLDVVRERTAAFQVRRNKVIAMLNDVPGLTCQSPGGAFYAYPNCSELIGRKTPAGSIMETDRDVVLYLMECAGVAAVHGAAYGLTPHFRLSIAASTDELEEACHRIQAACQALF